MFYTSVFDDSRILGTARYPEGSPGVAGTVMSVEWELGGERFQGINGGPLFQFSPAISVVVNVDTQDEVDRLWGALTSDGGEESQCGWLTDRFGVSWQVVPRALYEVMSGDDGEAVKRAYAAMLSMKKIDIAALRSTYAGE